MSACVSLTSEGSMIKAQGSRHWDTWGSSGKWWNRAKECWVGQRPAPEMPERIFRAAHDACKPVLTQTHSLPFPLVSISHLSSPCSVLSHRIWKLGFGARRPTQGEQKQQAEEEEEEEEVRTEREQEPGAEAGMRQVFCVRVACVSVHTYAVCSVPAVCLPHQWGRCCWGWWWCQWPCLAARLYSLLPLLMHGLSAWTHSPGSWPFVAMQMVELDATLEKS